MASILLDAQAVDTARARERIVRHFRDVMGSGASLDRAEGTNLAAVRAALGDVEGALRALERVEPLTAAFWFCLRNPDLDRIRATRGSSAGSNVPGRGMDW